MTIINPYDRIAQQDQDSGRSGVQRKLDGITYTPPNIAKAMVDMLSPRPHETIHEPSCGRGVFIFTLVDYWLDRGHSLDWIDQWAQHHLACTDTDEYAIHDLRELWNRYFVSRGHQPAPLNANVEDGIFGKTAGKEVDVIIGNPPYVRIQHLPEGTREAIRSQYQACQKGNVDLYYAFFEDALRRAHRSCLIMPNSWLGNASAKKLRMAAHPHITHLIDFGSRLIFAPTRAYTAIVLCDDEAEGVIQVRSNLPEEGGAWTTLGRDDTRWSDDRFYPLQPLGVSSGRTLGDLADLLSGIATLADHAFTLPTPETFDREGEMWIRQKDPLAPNDTAIEIPMRYARRLIKATKPGSLTTTGPRILYPYDENGTIVSEDILKKQAPGLLLWLERRREILNGRDKGKTQKYEAWYAYGRKQGFWKEGNHTEVVLIPQMGNGKLTPLMVNLTETGPFLFTSGYVIKPKEGSRLTSQDLADIISLPNTWNFVEREGKMWAGNGDYRSIGARALRRLPI